MILIVRQALFRRDGLVFLETGASCGLTKGFKSFIFPDPEIGGIA